MSNITLTPEQGRIFREFARYTALFDEAPTVIELADRVKLPAPLVADTLAYLVGIGWIILNPEAAHRG